MKRCAVQLELDIPMHGGAREGAGRPRVAKRPCVPHTVRARFRAGNVLHVTLRLRDGIPSLRQRGAWLVVVAVLKALRARVGFLVVQFSVQSNHLHLLIEADDARTLESGMRSLGTRLAKRLNRLFMRVGERFADRYHARALTTPRETRAALAYVLLNARKHAAEVGRGLGPHWVDPYSSAAAFDGWSGPVRVDHLEVDCGTAPATTWLLIEGWRRHGLIAIAEVPGQACARKHTHPWPEIHDAWGVDRARDAARGPRGWSSSSGLHAGEAERAFDQLLRRRAMEPRTLRPPRLNRRSLQTAGSGPSSVAPAFSPFLRVDVGREF